MIIGFDTIASTNDFLHDYQPCEEITVAWARFQTQGRGHSGRWVSDAGKNLLFSILLVPSGLAATDAFVLSQANALALRDTLQEFIREVWIKWPNDIYTHGCKIAGTLIENQFCGSDISRSVIGTGININQKQFPSGLAAPATSIVLETGYKVEPEDMLNRFVLHFEKYYHDVRAGRYNNIRRLYADALYLRGQQHLFADRNGTFTGIIQGVEPSGILVISDSNGVEHRYSFKEVRLK